MGLCCSKPDIETRTFTPIKITQERLTPNLGQIVPPTPRLSRSLTYGPGSTRTVSFDLPPPMDFLASVGEEIEIDPYLYEYEQKVTIASEKAKVMDNEIENSNNKWTTLIM
jgi:hypothetical protein